MQRGVTPGADFFDDGSSDSEWEDSEGDFTQTFTAGEDHGMRSLVHNMNGTKISTGRGRSRQRSTITALPSFPLPVHDSGLGTDYDDQASSPLDGKGASRARQMSLRRLNKDNVRLVHTRSSGDTPRDSLRSNDSDAASAIGEVAKPYPFPNLRHSDDTPRPLPQSPTFQGRHRRNTSESMIADSIINAHVMTMRALESLNSPTGSISHPPGQSYLHSATTTDFPKSASLSTSRHVTLSPVSTDRPAQPPAHFVKTPYPFTAKKEFPKPKSRPRQKGSHPGLDGRDAEEYARLDSAYGEEEVKDPHDDRKGKHVLGLVAIGGEFDLRSRLGRIESAQGLIRSCAGSGREGAEGVVWLSLERRTWRKSSSGGDGKLVNVVVPKDFTTSSPERGEKKFSLSKEVDFDDKFFAERLRAAHRELAGSWFRRTFSARKLRSIRLGQTHTWSGAAATQQPGRSVSGLLAVGEGMEHTSDTRSPFTEESLMKLYRKPVTGKARYTWVHWARRVSASNSLLTHQPLEKSTASSPASVTTIQFLHTPSKTNLLLALLLMLILSIAAALLWIFLGAAGTGYRNDVSRQRSDRVGSGVAVGVLVLLLESVGFGAWVAFS
jgi:hypothetical protein